MYSTILLCLKKYCLSLHYNSHNSYVFVDGKEIINFKAKDSEITPYLLCLGNTFNTLIEHIWRKWINWIYL